MGRGLMEMREGTLRLIPGGERFAEERIYTMVPWGAAAAAISGKGQPILIGTRSQGFFIFNGTTLTPFPTDLDDFLKRTLLYHGALLPDGSLALATTGGGLAILGKNGHCVKILDKKLGFQDDVVRYAFVDREWGIWLGLDNGTYRFRVRAMNIYGQVSQEDMYPFRVPPLWYRTGWAYILYLGLASFTLWAVSRARTRILRARNRILRTQIGEATLGLQALAKVCSELKHGALDLAPEELRVRLAKLPDLIEALRSRCRD